MTPARTRLWLPAPVALLLVAAACADASAPVILAGSALVRPAVRVYHSPYRDVNWESYAVIKGQHHDHFGLGSSALAAYDSAGYGAVSLMDYSGVASLSYAWHERRWPPSAWLTARDLARLKNIKIFIPNGEEVGLQHVTSSFMTTYIAKWEADYYPARQEWHYSTMPELLALIRRYGGVPVIAHPVGAWFVYYSSLDDYLGMEIYDALYLQQFLSKQSSVDLNGVMVTNWDHALLRNQSILGVSVNDHYGPHQKLGPDLAPEVRDSGKILVLAPRITASDYEAAFRAGTFFAVKDVGTVKDHYPRVRRIRIDDVAIEVTAEGFSAVRWISDGQTVGHEPNLSLRELPSTARYVRAEIANDEGSVVYTQAFTLRQVGDANGDGSVDADDTAVCAAVETRADSNPDHVDACAAH